MQASVSFLSTGKWFNHEEIIKYGHGFIIASHVREKLKYVLYASYRHPWHEMLSAYFLRHYDEYEILGGGGIVIHRGEMKLYPLSSIGYIPMNVAYSLMPLLQNKLTNIGIPNKLWIKSHNDDLKDLIKKLWWDWDNHIHNF